MIFDWKATRVRRSRIFLSFLTALVFFILFLPLISVNAQIDFGYTDINATEAKELMNQNPNAFILDARSWEEFTEGHIPNAVNIPYNQISQRINELPGVFSHLIIVYCDTGTRSSVAASILVQLSYTNVKNIEIGLLGWTIEGYPLVTDTDSNQTFDFSMLVFLILIGLVGVTFGFVLQRGKLCFNSAIKKAVLDKDFTLSKVFALTAAILIVVYFGNQTGIACSGAVLPLSFSLMTILAGVMFGGGMILAESCLSGICYKAGGGYGGAIIAFIGAITATFFLVLPPVVLSLGSLISETTLISGVWDLRLIELLNQDLAFVVLLFLPLIILLLLFSLNWQGLPTSKDFKSILQGKWLWWFSAIALAGVGLARLLLTYPTGRPASLGISGGFISLSQFVLQQSNFLLENIIVLGGVLLGAFLSAKLYGEFQIYIPPHKEKVKFFLGGVLLAVGATLAAGCNLAHLSAGLPQFAFSSIAFLSSLIITNGAGHYLLNRARARKQIAEIIPLPEGEGERDPRDTITWALKHLKEATTTEIIDKASEISHDCKDRVSGTLAVLLRDGVVKREISKEKKAFVWSLVNE
ncbi:MAG: YeeE/YedE thiosulfate transporter family protein [Promethearchaeota archaeon]